MYMAGTWEVIPLVQHRRNLILSGHCVSRPYAHDQELVHLTNWYVKTVLQLACIPIVVYTSLSGNIPLSHHLLQAAVDGIDLAVGPAVDAVAAADLLEHCGAYAQARGCMLDAHVEVA
jgi:hypothetical protein